MATATKRKQTGNGDLLAACIAANQYLCGLRDGDTKGCRCEQCELRRQLRRAIVAAKAGTP